PTRREAGSETEEDQPARVWLRHPRAPAAAQQRPRVRRSSPKASDDEALAQALDDGGVGQAAALAHGLEAVPAAGALELVEEGGGGRGAGAAVRVAEGDGAAVDVDLLHVRVELLLPGEDHGGEGLVALDQVDVVHLEAGLGEGLLGGGDGA